MIEKVKRMVNDFCEYEYGNEADFSDPSNIGLAYSETDEGLPVQVTLDLERIALIAEIGGMKVAECVYDSLEELIELELDFLSFDGLYYWAVNSCREGGAA